ncbi:hypothetical protein IFR04_000744 [Cadophora malorum]|uniref:Uncharacterized protein n=1 Tax=Cadophora malorum TaxID=108018 RepID=A0A8H8BW42_9HELO|nr:hypothetical protein IFR04_000744 [Cadophora malorum]
MKIPADGTLAGHATTPFSAVRPQVDDTEEDNNGDAEPEVVHGQSLIEGLLSHTPEKLAQIQQDTLALKA